MRSRWNVVDWKGLELHGARTVFVLGLVHVPPTVVALIAAEWVPAAICGALVAVGLVSGWAARGREPRRLALKEALFLTALTYPLFSVAGAFVFWPAAPFHDAFFEAVSGYTTTGLSIFVPEDLPTSLWFYRAWTQWVGGVGVLMLGMGVIQSTGRAQVYLYGAQLGPSSLPESPGALARSVVRVYVVLSFACALAYWASGVPVADALYLASTTVSTAGFAPRTGSVGAYEGMGPGIVAVLFMFVSAVNFPMLSRIRSHRGRSIWRDPQVHWLFALFAVGFFLVWIANGDPEHTPFETVFHVASAITTTGLSLNAQSFEAPALRFLLVAFMTLGGCGGSTVGGLKLWRLILLVKLVSWWITRQSVPREAVLRVKLMGRAVQSEELQGLGAFLFGFGALLFLTAWALMLTGASLGDAVFEASSALGNAGLSSGLTAPEMPPLRGYILCVGMWFGRLEVLPLLYLLVPRLWYGSEHRT